MTFILQSGIVVHLEVRQICHQIKNQYFQFIYKKKNAPVRFEYTALEIKVVRNIILNIIAFHDQPSRMHRSLPRSCQNFPDSKN